MSKILTIKEAIEVSQKLREQGKTIALAGGCFDILHIGHIRFLKEARQQGDMLFILLESDKTIQEKKGKDRPINSQADRALVLSEICLVDYIVTLSKPMDNQGYDNLVIALKPAIIATTKGDPDLNHKQRQAKLINARLSEVLNNVSNQSTTRLIKLLSKDKSL